MKKIVIIGPESTGKSTLCEDLSTYFKTTYLPEYSRVYLENNGPEYTYQDVLEMVKGQLESEVRFELGNPENPFLLFDTNYLVYKVWIKEKYALEEASIEGLLKSDCYDHYLLCNVDVPWEYDAYREHPNKKDRVRLFKEYEHLLMKHQLSFSTIKGNRDERLESAKLILNNLRN